MIGVNEIFRVKRCQTIISLFKYKNITSTSAIWNHMIYASSH